MHMTIIFKSNHFNTIIYIKQYYVPCLMQNKPSLNMFTQKSVENALKTLKMQHST